ncbi:hypothetical protein GCM10010266_57920 [Streptomyces griseomycini]|nr:hypothetical protein GCM10010266_57920 [Streptomyces griseomycini]GGR46141.1 hypothetical protein GCM10015536_59930 [Streptomyces griseomycini]
MCAAAEQARGALPRASVPEGAAAPAAPATLTAPPAPTAAGPDQEERRPEIGREEPVGRLLGPCLDREVGDVGGIVRQDVALRPFLPEPRRERRLAGYVAGVDVRRAA